MEPSASQKKDAEKTAALIELYESLFEFAMNDQWEKVVEAYKEKPESHTAKITEAEDTALHLAVSGGKLEFVWELVETLGKNASNVLKAKNKKGNTPLHIAAELGNAHMCYCMSSKDPNLIAERNKRNETPFFLAAHFGHKAAFLCLYFCYQGNHSEICSRDSCGNTILHAAIAGEHFDLAYQIVCKYPEFVNAVNADGSSPVHILATKTNAFKSGSRLGLLDQFLYRCVIVDEAKEKRYDSKDYYLSRFEPNGSHRRPCFPQNYDTCVHFFRMFLGVVCFGMPSIVEICSVRKSRFVSYIKDSDEENPQADTDKVTDQGAGPKTKAMEEHKNGLSPEEQRERYLPANYATFVQFFKFFMKFLLVVLGLGFQRIKKIRAKRQRHTWATQVMNKLIDNASMYKYFGGQTGFGEMMTEEFPCNPNLMDSPPHDNKINGNGRNSPTDQTSESNKQENCQNETDKKEGNAAMVEKFLEEYSITGTVDSTKTSKQAVMMKFEKKAAIESAKPKSPILIAARSALQMQWELKWYKFVKKSMAKHFLIYYNKKCQTPKQIFTETHKALVKDGSEWLTKTSESCSLIAALIATVAFATAANIPGGVREDTGEPVLRNEPAFGVFAISSLVALCFSVTALVFFLAILTSRFEEKDFAKKLPNKLILGLTSLFSSIAAILVSFCAGHFFELRDKLKFAEFSILYTATCLPVSFFALAQLPLYFDLLWAICKKVPQRGYKEFAS
ncbi:hypothetical protein CCACVL1_06670 [Corchorus capsularis]|uniref:PGG domain-containing protein n=1 Tax=Corchorus capsularis TaxID=210143 RepID=A0A1R3JDX7_COCAP|nr:hypothetical protein CCACVL1_06670 [Corchorus capsularis]